MARKGDPDAYRKGYEDAMRGRTPDHDSTTGGWSTTQSSVFGDTPVAPSGGDTGGKAAQGIGFAIGWLIVFPFGAALTAYCIAWVLGGSDLAEGMALFFGIICFCFALFAGVILIGWQLFVRLWPIIIPVVIVVIVVMKMT